MVTGVVGVGVEGSVGVGDGVGSGVDVGDAVGRELVGYWEYVIPRGVKVSPVLPVPLNRVPPLCGAPASFEAATYQAYLCIPG